MSRRTAAERNLSFLNEQLPDSGAALQTRSRSAANRTKKEGERIVHAHVKGSVVDLCEEEESEEEENEETENREEGEELGPLRVTRSRRNQASDQETMTDANKRLRRSTTSKRIAAPSPAGKTKARSTTVAAVAQDAKSSAAASSSSAVRPQPPTLPKDVENLDARRAEDPMHVSTYAADAFEHLRKMQFAYTTYSAQWIRKRPERRGEMVSWLMFVCDQYGMSTEVLYLSVSLYDRILQTFDVADVDFQLTCCACIMIACKMEDVYTPTVDEFLEMTEDTYTRTELLSMESLLLKKLDFQVRNATIKPFLRRFRRAAMCTSQEESSLHDFLGEISLLETTYLKFTPTLIAASCIYLARFMLICRDEKLVDIPALGMASPTVERVTIRLNKIWTPTLAHYTQYKVSHLAFVITTLWESMFVARAKGFESPVYGFTVNKFSGDAYQGVAKMNLAKGLGKLLPELSDDAYTEGGT